MELASYDVILTDYETLRSEFLYTDLNSSDRTLRANSARAMKRKSPLLFLNFWRVCLDESQMVSEGKTRHAQMVSQLSAVHRWAVTGTPIEKSLDDLFGLISFLNYSPYNEYTRWCQIVNQTYKSNFEPVVSMLQPIMWRTCKSQTVMDQMSVPKQTEQVHFVELSNLNRFHYNKECEKSREAELEAFHIFISRNSVHTPLANISPYELDRVRNHLWGKFKIIVFIYVSLVIGTSTEAAQNLFYSTYFRQKWKHNRYEAKTNVTVFDQH